MVKKIIIEFEVDGKALDAAIEKVGETIFIETVHKMAQNNRNMLNTLVHTVNAGISVESKQDDFLSYKLVEKMHAKDVDKLRTFFKFVE